MPKNSLKKTSFTFNEYFGWYLFVAAIILLIGIKYHFYSSKNPNVTVETKPQATPVPWNKIVQPNVRFNSEVLLPRTKTFLSIPIKYENSPQLTWMFLDSQNTNNPYQWLVSHPNFLTFNYPFIQDGSFRPYQKKPTYKTIESFLANPPQAKEIALDPTTKYLPKYKNIKGISIDANTIPENFNYLLTTYIPLTKRGDNNYYENTVDSSNGIATEKKITWWLETPTATESSPFYIGEIYVDYRK